MPRSLLLLVLLLLRTRASSFRALVRKPLLSSPFAAAVEDVARCRRTAANSRRENSSEALLEQPGCLWCRCIPLVSDRNYWNDAARTPLAARPSVLRQGK